jgi:hypothetical protein
VWQCRYVLSNAGSINWDCISEQDAEHQATGAGPAAEAKKRSIWYILYILLQSIICSLYPLKVIQLYKSMMIYTHTLQQI